MKTATIRNERLVALTKYEVNALNAMQKIYARRRQTIKFILDVIKYVGAVVGLFAFEMAIIAKDPLYAGPINWHHCLIIFFIIIPIVFFAQGFGHQLKKISKR